MPSGWRRWPLSERLRLLGKLTATSWRAQANPGQTLPSGAEPRVWWIQGARGSGKTRAGAQALAELILTHEAGEWACIAPTFGDARDTCVEGESGLLAALGPAVARWNRSIGELYVANGAIVHIDGADDGALRVQGKNLRGAWADEIGLWRKWAVAWEESLAFAVRIPPARIVCTGTPKGWQGIVRLLVEEAAAAPREITITRTFLRDNMRNLAPAQIASLERRYAGTRLGRQELEGEVLREIEGALWRWAMIDPYRIAEDPLRIGNRRVVAIDPAASSGPEADETGIVAAATDHTREGYVLADRSGHYTPREWAETAIGLYRELGADRIVAERNQGGEMVEAVIRQVDPDVPVRTVFATRGKTIRAEPVAALYEQGRVHHVEALPELENELTGWKQGDPSPSRLDALVWAFTDLILEREPGVYLGSDQPLGELPAGTITGDLWQRRF